MPSGEFCDPASTPSNQDPTWCRAATLHFVANVPASLKAARLRRLGIGLRRGLPYALAHTRIQTDVADTSAASTSTANPLPLEVVVSLIAAAPHALHVSKLPVIAFPVLMLVVHGVRMLSLEREVLHVSIHAVHAG